MTEIKSNQDKFIPKSKTFSHYAKSEMEKKKFRELMQLREDQRLMKEILAQQKLVGTSSDVVEILGKPSREIIASCHPQSSTIITQLTQTNSPTRAQLIEEAKAAFSNDSGIVNNVIRRIKNPSTGETIGIQMFDKEKTLAANQIKGIYKILNKLV